MGQQRLSAGNVANARDDATSIYQLYRRLIATRRDHAALTLGRFCPVVAQGDLILYVREQDDDRVLVALNLGGAPTSVDFPQPIRGRVLVSAFAGLDRMKAAYAHAIREGYRFYSYGDSSLLLRAEQPEPEDEEITIPGYGRCVNALCDKLGLGAIDLVRSYQASMEASSQTTA